ncbi:MAG TPA: Uma2 family endonuclease [Rhodopila sp.]
MKPWTIDQFFAWQTRQAERHELIGGFPVRMVAGARNVHNDIVINILAELRARLRGSGCHPFNGDGAIETLPGQIRRPDAGVDCGQRDPDAFMAALPHMVAEVLSPTTRDFDTFEKLAEYQQVASLDCIMVVEPNAPEVTVWSRGPDRTWVRRIVEGLDQDVAMPTIGITLPLAEIYDDIAFPARPRLVRMDEPREETAIDDTAPG